MPRRLQNQFNNKNRSSWVPSRFNLHFNNVWNDLAGIWVISSEGLIRRCVHANWIAMKDIWSISIVSRIKLKSNQLKTHFIHYISNLFNSVDMSKCNTLHSIFQKNRCQFHLWFIQFFIIFLCRNRKRRSSLFWL